MSVDAQGDSQMNSSPSSPSSNSSSMFPAAATTPPHGPSTQQLHSVELSPPESQERGPTSQLPDSREERASNDADAPMTGSNARPAAEESQAPLLPHLAANRPSEGAKDEDRAAGWAWRNAKAMEDAQRSLDMVLDTGFNLREFGDPYDEREFNGERL